MTKAVPRPTWAHLVSIAFLIAVSLSFTIILDGSVREVVLAHQDPMVYTVMAWLTWMGNGWVLLLLAGGLLAWGVWHKQRTAKMVGGAGLVALLLSRVVVEGLKHLIGRPRPWMIDSGASHFGPSQESGYDSFPSGHAISAFAMAVVLSSFYPRWRWVWYGAAVLVAFSRVYMDVHFTSDVVAGAILGVCIAKAVIDNYPRILHHES